MSTLMLPGAFGTADDLLPPNNTVYAKNINEKISVDGVWKFVFLFVFMSDQEDFVLFYTELKKSLFHLFSNYGKVLDITAAKTLKAKGQAFIVFENLASSARALRELQGFNFHGKPLVWI